MGWQPRGQPRNFTSSPTEALLRTLLAPKRDTENIRLTFLPFSFSLTRHDQGWHIHLRFLPLVNQTRPSHSHLEIDRSRRTLPPWLTSR